MWFSRPCDRLPLYKLGWRVVGGGGENRKVSKSSSAGRRVNQEGVFFSPGSNPGYPWERGEGKKNANRPPGFPGNPDFQKIWILVVMVTGRGREGKGGDGRGAGAKEAVTEVTLTLIKKLPTRCTDRPTD